MDTGWVFRWIVAPIIVFSVVFLLAFFIPRQLYEGVGPIGTGITNKIVGLENNYEFKKDDLELDFLLDVKVEAHTALKNLKKKESIAKPLHIKELGDFPNRYKYFNLTFIYESDKGFVKVPNDYLKNLLITFKVDKKWIDDNKLKKEDITLLAWNDRHNAWTANKAYFLNEEKDNYVYQASSLYHGLFVICAG